jgi:hypothetical protein
VRRQEEAEIQAEWVAPAGSDAGAGCAHGDVAGPRSDTSSSIGVSPTSSVRDDARVNPAPSVWSDALVDPTLSAWGDSRVCPAPSVWSDALVGPTLCAGGHVTSGSGPKPAASEDEQWSDAIGADADHGRPASHSNGPDERARQVRFCAEPA